MILTVYKNSLGTDTETIIKRPVNTLEEARAIYRTLQAQYPAAVYQIREKE